MKEAAPMAEVCEGTELRARIERCFDAADWSHGRLWVEQYLDGDDMVLRAVLPNIDPDEDVEIYLGDGIVHIEAHCDKTWQNRGSYRSKFSCGSFARNIAVPPGVDEGSLKATYADEVLEIRIPVEPARMEWVKRIPVTRTGRAVTVPDRGAGASASSPSSPCGLPSVGRVAEQRVRDRGDAITSAGPVVFQNTSQGHDGRNDRRHS